MRKHKNGRIDKYHLSLSGEYRVASELLKRGLNATVTFGNAKSADVIAYGCSRKAVVIEVKTSQQKNFITGFYNKYRNPGKNPEREHPDFWVLVKVDTEGNSAEEFFILSHMELAAIQAKRNRDYLVRHGTVQEDEHLEWDDYYRLTNELHGVDNALLTDVTGHRDGWDKILDACGI